MSESTHLIDALAPVAESLRQLGIRHFVGGSVASSFHGAIRSTMDVDLVCEMTQEHVSTLIELLGGDYYSSEAAIRDAVERKACFNLIHLPTSFKVDLFISRGRAFDEDSMRRATLERIGDVRTVEVPIATAEDSIISKLEWYRMGGEVSERQWDDVSRLIALLGDQADMNYLRQAAQSVGVESLLERLLSQE